MEAQDRRMAVESRSGATVTQNMVRRETGGKGEGNIKAEGSPVAGEIGTGPLRVVVSGIDCAGCVDEIACEISSLPGVVSSTVEAGAGEMPFDLDPGITPLAEFTSRLHEMGYGAAVVTPVLVEKGVPPWRSLEVADLPSGQMNPPLDSAAHAHDHSHHGHHGHGLACAHPPYQKSGAGSSRWVAMLGTVSAGVCLVHCLALPFVLGAMALLPAVGALLHETAELVLVGVTLILAWVSVGASYGRHRKALPLYFLLAGTLFSALGQVFPHEATASTLVTRIAGAGFLVAAIWINRAALRKAVYPVQVESLVVED